MTGVLTDVDRVTLGGINTKHRDLTPKYLPTFFVSVFNISHVMAVTELFHKYPIFFWHFDAHITAFLGCFDFSAMKSIVSEQIFCSFFDFVRSPVTAIVLNK
jgi:hypothetical protein